MPQTDTFQTQYAGYSREELVEIIRLLKLKQAKAGVCLGEWMIDNATLLLSADSKNVETLDIILDNIG